MFHWLNWLSVQNESLVNWSKENNAETCNHRLIFLLHRGLLSFSVSRWEIRNCFKIIYLQYTIIANTHVVLIHEPYPFILYQWNNRIIKKTYVKRTDSVSLPVERADTGCSSTELAPALYHVYHHTSCSYIMHNSNTWLYLNHTTNQMQTIYFLKQLTATCHQASL